MQVSPETHLALVARSPLRPMEPGQYLMRTPEGVSVWTADPEAATAFPTMRDATRAALGLPAALRAYAVPRRSEVFERSALH